MKTKNRIQEDIVEAYFRNKFQKKLVLPCLTLSILSILVWVYILHLSNYFIIVLLMFCIYSFSYLILSFIFSFFSGYYLFKSDRMKVKIENKVYKLSERIDVMRSEITYDLNDITISGLNTLKKIKRLEKKKEELEFEKQILFE